MCGHQSATEMSIERLYLKDRIKMCRNVKYIDKFFENVQKINVKLIAN